MRAGGREERLLNVGSLWLRCRAGREQDMAKRRESAPAEEPVRVPAWVLTCVEADWLQDDVRQPPGYEWMHPERWRQMHAHARWSAARRAWLTDHGIPQREWRNFAVTAAVE